MNGTMIELAKRAGFIFWEQRDQIDWSCDYSNEFDKYSILLIQHTIEQLKLGVQSKRCE